MTAYTWKTAANGTFETAANWTPTGGPPGGADDALLTLAGTYTATTTVSDTVNDLQTAAGATLAVGPGLTFTMTNGTGAGANAGHITVANNSVLFLGGTVNNSGNITITAAANFTDLRLLGSTSTTTLTGGGSLTLAGNTNVRLYGVSSSDTLENVNNTINGLGQFGSNQLTFKNDAAGIVNANQTTALTMQMNGGATNAGTLEATNTGGLLINGTGINNAGGTISATGTGSHVDLQASSVSGGTLTSGAGAYIDTITGTSSTLDGSTASGAITITAGTNLNLVNNSTIYLQGSIVNHGTINLQSAANYTDLRFGSGTTPTLTLSGGGKVVLGSTGIDRIYGNNSQNTLVNVDNTISGGGQVGSAQMTFINQTAGVVNANLTAAMTLNVNGGVQNNGLLEATNTGGLLIQNTGVDNEGNSNGGKINATVSGAHVDLSSSSIAGGTLSAVAGAYFDTITGTSDSLLGQDPGAPINITAGTNINVTNNSTLNLYGVINNAGVINIQGAANNTNLVMQTPQVTLTGGGQVLLDGTTGNSRIYGVSNANQLINVNNTIAGYGQLGSAQMSLVNQAAGVINANQTNQLLLNVNEGVVNTGLIEATNSGGLLIQNTGIDNTQSNGTIVNSGLISATGVGSHIDLQSSTIYGGTLTSAAGDYFDTLTATANTLDGSYAGAPVIITAGTNVNIVNNSTLNLAGVIYNSGTINLGVPAEANNTFIRLASSTVTLTTATPTLQGGIIQLANTSNSYIQGADAYSETLNNVNNIIQGSGNIGGADMTLINGAKGIIDANQAPNGTGQPGQMTIQVNGGVTNAGLIESTVAPSNTVGGTLLILNTAITQATTGKIEALGLTVGKLKYGSTVYLQSSSITGGLLSSTAGNALCTFQTVTATASTLSSGAAPITVSALLDVVNNSTLYLAGNITTTKGVITLQGAANATYLTVNAPTVTLAGAGTITLAGTGNNYIQAAQSHETLNNTNNIIQGAGNIGNGGSLVFINSGTVNANNATTHLVIQDGPTVENNGTIESTAAGGLLVLNSNIDNTYGTSTGVLNTGKMTATGTGHIDLQSSNLYGGTLTSSGGGYFDTVTGTGSGLNGAVLGQAVNIAAGTNFNIVNNSTLYLYGVINNAGVITIQGAANATYISANSSLVTLTGAGQVVLGGTGNNIIQQNQSGCEIDNVNNTISGSGNIGNGGGLTFHNEAAGVVNAKTGGLTINTQPEVVNAGLIEGTTGALAITNAVFNTGTIEANGANVTIGNNVDGVGALEIFGTAKLEVGLVNGAAANQTVTFEAGAAGTFKIDNAQYFAGSVVGLSTGNVIDLGNIAIGTASLSYNATTKVLTVKDGTYVSNIQLVGNYTQANFSLTNDGGGHTDVTYAGTGLGPVVNPGAVGTMAAAMASMGASHGSSATLSSAALGQSASLLALPHAA